LPLGAYVRLPVLLLAAALALGFDLGGYPLFDPDEGRNAEVAREIAATNDYVLPHLDGLPYLDKPIVYFAAAAASVLWIDLDGHLDLAADPFSGGFEIVDGAIVLGDRPGLGVRLEGFD